MKTKYRIVTDRYEGFCVQYKRWWWVFWMDCDRHGGFGTNSFSSLEMARLFIEEHRELCKWKQKIIMEVL